MKKIITFPFIAGLFISSTVIASEFNDGIDKIFSSIKQHDSPGCNVGLIKDGAFVHKAGYGLANLELNVPLDGTQVHRMASVSKQFTAMAVLLLAEEGAIDLDANITTYLKELNDYGEIVTVRSMLGHYSGMGDYDLIAGSYEGQKSKNSIDLKSVAGGDFRLGNEDYLTIKEFYDVVKTVPLALKPDQKFQYSNLAYFLLSMLVEEVSGKSLRDYADEKIFKPLDMTSTFFSDDPVEIVKKRATGYKKNKDDNYITDMTNLFWVGDGGLHTNLDDLLKWDQNFYTPIVGKEPKKLMELMNKPNSNHKSRGSVYANGQFVGETVGKKSFAHGGGWLGTSTYYIRFPEEKFSLAMLCNDVSLKVGTIRKNILELYFNGK
ncbi:serine hydrolase domain-containing protein [Paraglaciecola arctica]|uniref:serine hydrolase domain-containing protein n=1 Tax=Paraglaciecola arctica TaxID=1128911 RepID=UPI001C06FA2D|nr:serine hydrolase domain-containing protein [Paraglaciecola arctica]MBU3003389.1 beta-lactamase family protein [Paraglaciecola arctica]